MPRSLRTLPLAALLLSATTPLWAGVTRIEVQSTESAPRLPGAADYEILRGVFHGEIDPADPHNSVITDLAAAPRNTAGKVEYTATFAIARPVDPTQGSGVLYYDVPNRGRAGVAADADGNIRVISGWQGDIPPDPSLQTVSVPVATGPGGRPITGRVLARFENIPADDPSTAIGGGLPPLLVPRPRPVSLDTHLAKLIRQDRGAARPVPITRGWAFADCRKTSFPGTPDPGQLCLKGGFDPNAAYTLVYEGKDPQVLGIGFAATRDLVSFLRAGKPDATGNPDPVGTGIRWTVSSGTSQSGNFLRSFIRLGFNADEAGKRVFDGINPNIAARQVPLNLRFGVPGGAAGAFEPGSEGTLWWSTYDDRLRGLGPSSLLDRCAASDTCPKVLETLGSAEFWGLRASPDFVGTDASADIPLPANVRRYYFPSVTHGGGRGNSFTTKLEGTFGSCMLPGNPNPSAPTLRALQKALIAWVKDGKEPPASRYPTLANGDLVLPQATAMGWPSIPGAPIPDGKINPFIDQNFGPGFSANDVSGIIASQPPATRRIMPSLVPRVDADGNETAGVPSVQLQVPLGTYLGWNVAAKGYGRDKGCGFEGGFIPFARTREERLANHDPRPSLQERFGNHAGLVSKVREVVARQQAEGWLLAQDAEIIVRQADDSDVLK